MFYHVAWAIWVLIFLGSVETKPAPVPVDGDVSPNKAHLFRSKLLQKRDCSEVLIYCPSTGGTCLAGSTCCYTNCCLPGYACQVGGYCIRDVVSTICYTSTRVVTSSVASLRYSTVYSTEVSTRTSWTTTTRTVASGIATTTVWITTTMAARKRGLPVDTGFAAQSPGLPVITAAGSPQYGVMHDPPHPAIRRMLGAIGLNKRLSYATITMLSTSTYYSYYYSTSYITSTITSGTSVVVMTTGTTVYAGASSTSTVTSTTTVRLDQSSKSDSITAPEVTTTTTAPEITKTTTAPEITKITGTTVYTGVSGPSTVVYTSTIGVDQANRGDSTTATGSNSRGLSVGETVGIAVGAFVGFLLLLGLVYLAWRLCCAPQPPRPPTPPSPPVTPKEPISTPSWPPVYPGGIIPVYVPPPPRTYQAIPIAKLRGLSVEEGVAELNRYKEEFLDEVEREITRLIKTARHRDVTAIVAGGKTYRVIGRGEGETIWKRFISGWKATIGYADRAWVMMNYKSPPGDNSTTLPMFEGEELRSWLEGPMNQKVLELHKAFIRKHPDVGGRVFIQRLSENPTAYAAVAQRMAKAVVEAGAPATQHAIEGLMHVMSIQLSQHATSHLGQQLGVALAHTGGHSAMVGFSNSFAQAMAKACAKAATKAGGKISVKSVMHAGLGKKLAVLAATGVGNAASSLAAAKGHAAVATAVSHMLGPIALGTIAGYVYWTYRSDIARAIAPEVRKMVAGTFERSNRTILEQIRNQTAKDLTNQAAMVALADADAPFIEHGKRAVKELGKMTEMQLAQLRQLAGSSTPSDADTVELSGWVEN